MQDSKQLSAREISDIYRYRVVKSSVHYLKILRLGQNITEMMLWYSWISLVGYF
jgi:hypothetical protein